MSKILSKIDLLLERVHFGKMSDVEIEQHYSGHSKSEYVSRLKRALSTAEKNEELNRQKIQKLKSLLMRASSQEKVENIKKETEKRVEKPQNKEQSLHDEIMSHFKKTEDGKFSSKQKEENVQQKKPKTPKKSIKPKKEIVKNPENKSSSLRDEIMSHFKKTEDGKFRTK